MYVACFRDSKNLADDTKDGFGKGEIWQGCQVGGNGI